MRVLLFVAIVTVLGSLKQPDKYVCKNMIRQQFFLNGKIVFTTTVSTSNLKFGEIMPITDHPSNKKFNTDSVTYNLVWQN